MATGSCSSRVSVWVGSSAAKPFCSVAGDLKKVLGEDSELQEVGRELALSKADQRLPLFGAGELKFDDADSRLCEDALKLGRRPLGS